MNKLAKLAAQKDDKSAQQYPEGSFLAGGLPKNQSNALSQAATPLQPPISPKSAPMQPAQPQGQPASPQQGAQPSKPFNGPVNVGGTTIHVKGGVAIGVKGEMTGKKFFVSADGKVVWDEQGKVLGDIDAQHNFVPATPQMLQQLAAAGVIKMDGQQAPQGAPQGQTPPLAPPQGAPQ